MLRVPFPYQSRVFSRRKLPTSAPPPHSAELPSRAGRLVAQAPLSPSAQEVTTEERGTTGARLALFSRKVGFWAFDPEFLAVCRLRPISCGVEDFDSQILGRLPRPVWRSPIIGVMLFDLQLLKRT